MYIPPSIYPIKLLDVKDTKDYQVLGDPDYMITIKSEKQ